MVSALVINNEEEILESLNVIPEPKDCVNVSSVSEYVDRIELINGETESAKGLLPHQFITVVSARTKCS